MKRRRVWIAAVVIWSLAFAQAAVAAHACAILIAAGSPVPSIGASAPEMPPGCADMAGHTDSTVNVCQSHCLADQQTQGQADVPLPGIAPQPALVIRIAEARLTTGALALTAVTPAAAPPPQLLYNRFLI
ncbi:MAG TPA: hypothetical protein VF420_11155 [Casimicrobiaceae bacterium]